MDGDGNAQERGLLDEFESLQCFELDLVNHVPWRWGSEKEEEETDCIGLEDTGVRVSVHPMHSRAPEPHLCSEHRNKPGIGAGGTHASAECPLRAVWVSWDVLCAGVVLCAFELRAHAGDLWACWSTQYVREMQGTVCVKEFGGGSGFLR